MDKGAAKMNGTSQATGAMNGTSQANAGGVVNSGNAATSSKTIEGAKLPRIPTAPRGDKFGAASKQGVVAQNTRPKAPPPPSSRRELPAPTPLVLPSRLQGVGSSTAARGQKASPAPTRVAKNQGVSQSVAKSQSAARQTLALKKAPPPPSSRRNQSASSPVPSTAAPKPKQSHQRTRQGSARVESVPSKNSHDVARQADAQWAAHLDQPRDLGRVADYRVPEEPPQLPDNLPLLNLEGEISALRPRPSEIPPEPAGIEHSEAARHAHQDAETEGLASPKRAHGAYRRKTPSDLSLLYQAMPSPDRSVGLSSVRTSNSPRSRGYVPKAPHEFLPPPPPPNKRGAAKSFSGEEDDEAPTQARRPAIHPYEVTPPPPEMVMPSSRRDSTPVPGPASMIVPATSRAVSPIPPPTAMVGAGRLPAPPPLPTGLHAETTWEDREWTDSRHLEAIQLDAVSPVPLVNPTPVPTAYEARPAPVSHGATDSVRPTALTVPAPARARFPTFGLPPGWVPVAGASVLGAAISAGAFILPDRGQLLIDVSNQSWTSLRDAQVYVNDELVCTQSPCAVKVDAAPQRVRVTAPGYQPSGEDSVIVSEGSVTLHKVQLGASADTGIEIQTSVPNLQLYVDGRRIGSLPRKVMGLPPGEHTLVVSGGDSFTTEERRIQLEPNQTLVINDLQPKLKSGTLELRAGDNANGARVTLDGAQISLPFKATLEPGRRYALHAEREGYAPFEQSIQVDPANPVLNVALDLSPLASEESSETQSAEPASRWSRSRWRWQAGQQSTPDTEASSVASRAPTETKEPAHADDGGSLGDSALGAAMRQSVGLPAAEKTEKSEAKSGGSGSINIVTSPSAVILLDGKPVGKTPKRLTVSAGKHSLVLIHPNGRKRASISVEPGANKTIKASF